MKRALYLPGPSFFDERVKAAAGWWAIMEYQREAIAMAGLEVDVAKPDPQVYQDQPPIAKYLSYGLPYTNDAYDLVVGAPAYGFLPLVSKGAKKRVSYVWNNSAQFRRAQLKEEYELFGYPYPEDLTSEMLNSIALDASDLIIACSPFVFRTHRAITRTRIEIAPWGVDSALFHPGDGSGSPRGQLSVLFVGSDPIRKGLPYLFGAVAKVPNVTVAVVGCDIVPPESIKDRITVLGPRPFAAMPEVYRQGYDVIAIPTLEDGIACAIQEGMASGLVPVTSPDAGEVFEHRREGFVCGFRDTEAIARALEVLRDNVEERKRMAAAARAKAETQTWASFKERFAQIIREEME